MRAWLTSLGRACFGTPRRFAATLGAFIVLLFIFSASFRATVYGAALDTLGIAFAIFLVVAILSAVTGRNLFWWPKRRKKSSDRS